MRLPATRFRSITSRRASWLAFVAGDGRRRGDEPRPGPRQHHAGRAQGGERRSGRRGAHVRAVARARFAAPGRRRAPADLGPRVQGNRRRRRPRHAGSCTGEARQAHRIGADAAHRRRSTDRGGHARRRDRQALRPVEAPGSGVGGAAGDGARVVRRTALPARGGAGAVAAAGGLDRRGDTDRRRRWWRR